MSNKTVNIEPFGAVKFTINNRISRLSIRVKEGSLYVSAPVACQSGQIMDFIRSKTDWIFKQQKAQKSTSLQFDTGTTFTTRYHKLTIERTSRKEVSAIRGNGKIQVFIPHDYDCKNQGFQIFVRKVIARVMRIEAKQYLPGRLKELADKCGLKFHNVFIKELSTRWGSCSSENNINLNLHLMRLPDKLIDYVLYHELTHLVERNHSPKFWNLLDKYCLGAKTLDKELKMFKATF